MGFSKELLLARLQELGIHFVSYEHPVVLTLEAQAKYVGHLGSALSKNLFLKDKKHRLYVVSALADTKVDLKVLSQRLGLGKGGLRMAPEESLQEVLQVPLGCVTPFALINESARSVALLLDQGLKAQKCLFHPLSNDMTISLSANDLDKFLISIGRSPSYVDLEAIVPVGKDQPPDLATLVPTEIVKSLDVPQQGTPIQIAAENHMPREKKLMELQGTEKISNKSKPAGDGVTKKPSGDKNPSTGVADVQKFVNEIMDKTSAILQAEVSEASIQKHGKQLGNVLSDTIRKRLTLDLENLVMIFKNTAYTEGFQSKIGSLSLHK
ncbi:hypothetical protein AMTRI_Chr04g249330 [Amborella trichopoda]